MKILKLTNREFEELNKLIETFTQNQENKYQKEIDWGTIVFGIRNKLNNQNN